MSEHLARYNVDIIHEPQDGQLEELRRLMVASSFTTEGTIVDGLSDRSDQVIAVKDARSERYLAAAYIDVAGHIATIGALFGSAEAIPTAVHPIVMKLTGERSSDLHLKVVLADVTAAQPTVTDALAAEGFTVSPTSQNRMILTNTGRLSRAS